MIKQTGVSLSIIEAEYIAASKTAKSVVITRGILHELGIIPEDFAFPLLIDNTGAIAISGGEKVTRNARYIDIRYHHIRDLIEKKTIEISHIPTSGMATDGLTKALMANKFKEFVELVGVSKIKADSDSEDNKASDSKANKVSDGEDDSDSNSDENDEIFENSTDEEIKIGKDYYEKEAE